MVWFPKEFQESWNRYCRHRGLFRKVLRAKVRLYGSMHPPWGGGWGQKSCGLREFWAEVCGIRVLNRGILIRDLCGYGLFLKLNRYMYGPRHIQAHTAYS